MISSIMGPLLSDRSENETAQEEVIRHCYVTTPLSDQADASLDSLIRDGLPSHLMQAGVVDVLPSGKNPFYREFKADVEKSRPGSYILTGGVGSGKTTFLRRFVVGVNRPFVEIYCVWLHIDFLAVGNVDPAQVDQEIRAYAFSAIRRQLEYNYPKYVPSSGDDVKSLFSEELERASMTKLFGLKEGGDAWIAKVSSILDDLFNDPEKFSFAILKQLRRRGLRIVIVLDNNSEKIFRSVYFFFLRGLARNIKLCVSWRCVKKSSSLLIGAGSSTLTAIIAFILARLT
jgi:hypothetical protein